MSFDVFIDAYRAGEPGPYPISILEDAFGPFIVSRDSFGWGIEFPDGGSAEIFVDQAPTVTHFCVNRPTANPRLWGILVEVMRETVSVCYWPGVQQTVVADLAHVPELPEDMVRALGDPIEVKDGAALLARVEAEG